jgi:uncharacterized protein YbjT (DUF2867 family)
LPGNVEEIRVKVVIIGGHGKVARLAAPLLVAAGHDVTSLIRNPRHREDITSTGAVPVVADIEHLDVDALVEHLRGHDAVVWSAGAGGGDPARTDAVDRVAAIRSMDAARAAGVDRYVMVSYFGAGPDHGVDPSSGFYAYAEAKAGADAHLRATDLAWTIVAPSALTSDPGTGLIDVGDGLTAGSVPREDVARVLVAVLERPATAGSFIAFNTGTMAIDDAVARFER